jgi:HTH-type transcriptional regulator / antitoxin HipB
MDYPVRTLGQLRPILKGFRKTAGLTQAMMASRLGVTQQTYAQLEANPAAVSVERLFKVLRTLNVDLTLAQGAVPSQSVATKTQAAGGAVTARKAPKGTTPRTTQRTIPRTTQPATPRTGKQQAAPLKQALKQPLKQQLKQPLTQPHSRSPAKQAKQAIAAKPVAARKSQSAPRKAARVSKKTENW